MSKFKVMGVIRRSINMRCLIVAFVFAKIIDKSEAKSSSLIEYLINSRVGLEKNCETLGVVLSNKSSYVADSFLKYGWSKSRLVFDTSGPLHLPTQKQVIETYVCFVDSDSEIARLIKFIKSRAFLKTNGNLKLVVTGSVDLDAVLVSFWNADILNIVVVYQDGDLVRVVGYNPFKPSLLEFTYWNRDSNVFVDKLNDLKGFRLRVAMMTDYVRNLYVNGELIGPDVSLAYEIGASINASVEMVYFDTITELIAAVQLGKVHCSFSKVFTSAKLSYLINPSQPIEFEYLGILMPTASIMPQYSYVSKVFEPLLWISLTLTLMFVMAFRAVLAAFQGKSPIKAVFVVYEMFLSSSCLTKKEIEELPTSENIFYTIWLIYAMLVSMAFSTELGGSLVTPMYYKDIETLQELANTKMKILAYGPVVGALYDSVQVIYDNLEQLSMGSNYIEELLKYKKDKAYLLAASYKDYLTVKVDENKRPIYKMLEETLAVAHNIYDFAKDSPFKQKIDELLVLYRELGLGTFGLRPVHGKMAVALEEPICLTVHHLQSAFLVATIGSIAGVVVFVLECCYAKYWKDRNVIKFGH